ncbi:PadR family transcriptional regulator [Tsukamurella soli]
MLGDIKLTPLGIAALSLLTERDMHPYEMFQTLMARREDVIVKVRPGSLYHAVNRLAEDELVEAVGTERDGNRPERTTYRITRPGRYALRSRVGDMLANPAREYPAFPVAVSKAHDLPADEVASHLRNRRSVLERDVTVLRDTIAALPDKPRVFLLDIEYLAVMREAEIAWVSALLDDIEGDTIAWPALARTTGEGEDPS